MAKPERARKERRELERRAVKDGIEQAPPQLQAFLGKLPLEERNKVVAYFEHTRTTTVSTGSGMPPPEFLAQYQAIWPEAIEFFSGEVKLQAQHRRAIETVVIPGQVVLAKRGQVVAACLVLITLAVGVYLVERGFSNAGIGVFALLGVGYATNFLKSTFEKKGPKQPEEEQE